MRRSVEHDLFRVPPTLDAADRPVYGMLFQSSRDATFANYVKSGPGYWYGAFDGVVVILDKKKISDFTTFTCGDSLDYCHSVKASTVFDPHFYGSGSWFATGFADSKDFMDAKLEKIFRFDDNYVELQLHGKASHSINNFSEVVFTKSQPSQRVIDRLTELGIKVTVL